MKSMNCTKPATLKTQVGNLLLCQSHAAPMQAFMKFDTLQATSAIHTIPCAQDPKHLHAKMYCKKCNKVLCADCEVSYHRQHGTTAIADLQETWKQQLKASLKQTDTKEKRETYKNLLKEMQQVM